MRATIIFTVSGVATDDVLVSYKVFGQIKVFFLSLVTLPEVIAKVNLINFSSCFASGK